VLLALAFGVVEYGYFIYVKELFQESAQAGARVAVQSTATDAAVRAEIDSRLLAAGFASNSYTVSTSPPSVATIATDTTVIVTVTASWGTVGVRVLPTYLGGIPTSKPVVGRSTMIRE
jgi:Flp pilus assembly protein TadG